MRQTYYVQKCAEFYATTNHLSSNLMKENRILHVVSKAHQYSNRTFSHFDLPVTGCDYIFPEASFACLKYPLCRNSNFARCPVRLETKRHENKQTLLSLEQHHDSPE